MQEHEEYDDDDDDDDNDNAQKRKLSRLESSNSTQMIHICVTRVEQFPCDY